jgi:hypothetical protein
VKFVTLTLFSENLDYLKVNNGGLSLDDEIEKSPPTPLQFSISSAKSSKILYFIFFSLRRSPPIREMSFRTLIRLKTTFGSCNDVSTIKFSATTNSNTYALHAPYHFSGSPDDC